MFETFEDSQKGCFCHLLCSLSLFKVVIKSSMEVLISADRSTRASLFCKIWSELDCHYCHICSTDLSEKNNAVSFDQKSKCQKYQSANRNICVNTISLRVNQIFLL